MGELRQGARLQLGQSTDPLSFRVRYPVMLQPANSPLAEVLPAAPSPSLVVPREGHGTAGGCADPPTLTSPAATPGTVSASPDASEPHTLGYCCHRPFSPPAHFATDTPTSAPPLRGSPMHPATTLAIPLPIWLPREQLALPGLTHTKR